MILIKRLLKTEQMHLRRKLVTLSLATLRLLLALALVLALVLPAALVAAMIG